VPPPPTNLQVEAAKQLDLALNTQNPDLVESAVNHASSILHPIHAAALVRLAEASWHRRHEDVVHALQVLRTPDAVAALERTAFSAHEYLAYDKSYALARKCTWALADIGTPEAYEALGRIAACNDPAIAEYARKRLDNWQRELSRKSNR
jgi:hypothetical protein